MKISNNASDSGKVEETLGKASGKGKQSKCDMGHEILSLDEETV
jgi:hypothetical protein